MMKIKNKKANSRMHFENSSKRLLKCKRSQRETGLPGWLVNYGPWIVLFIILLIAITFFIRYMTSGR